MCRVCALRRSQASPQPGRELLQRPLLEVIEVKTVRVHRFQQGQPAPTQGR